MIFDWFLDKEKSDDRLAISNIDDESTKDQAKTKILVKNEIGILPAFPEFVDVSVAKTSLALTAEAPLVAVLELPTTPMIAIGQINDVPFFQIKGSNKIELMLSFTHPFVGWLQANNFMDKFAKTAGVYQDFVVFGYYHGSLGGSFFVSDLWYDNMKQDVEQVYAGGFQDWHTTKEICYAHGLATLPQFYEGPLIWKKIDQVKSQWSSMYLGVKSHGVIVRPLIAGNNTGDDCRTFIQAIA